MSKRRLTEEKLEELNAWLHDNNFRVTRMHRDCSDALKVANLISVLWPKLIDTQNYPVQSSVCHKLSNWEVLDRKVLSKLGLKQTHSTLVKLAQGTPGIAEVLLYRIMKTKEKSDRLEKTKYLNEQEKNWAENSEMLVVQIRKSIGDAVVSVPQKMIAYSIYKDKCRECELKDNKIAHLEKVIQQRNERISKLCFQAAQLIEEDVIDAEQYTMDSS